MLPLGAEIENFETGSQKIQSARNGTLVVSFERTRHTLRVGRYFMSLARFVSEIWALKVAKTTEVGDESIQKKMGRMQGTHRAVKKDSICPLHSPHFFCHPTTSKQCGWFT
ncbi:hypothetical protein AVEN_139735-1 [Araneus ventricosus]|uniref:Uncharacterized protein n=1 Tax=Araneus ventricosus TaxID=182803 RepID=A0A4Y2LJT9_ARAVE|nr:hypothetical protein AVEN_139735-1 [Araneus ventricosus]